ncbi:MAG: ABC transporter ATP-binding protein [Elusimicrobia bacterium]|nr:ABC transporter ATP-binding protein [Elusimicrobiota bacterium]
MVDNTNKILELQGVHAVYGKKIRALKGVDLSIRRGEIVALIGCNGAGKTTMLKTISGLLPAEQGTILFKQAAITNLASHEIARLGLAHVPEGRKIFSRLTVLENLEMGAFARSDAGGIERDLRHVFELFPILGQRRDQSGGTLSGGEQQMLAIARALMMRPELLMLDEPSMGLAPVVTDKIFEIITAINREGKTIFLVEQNAARALEIAHRAYVIETGAVIMEDKAQNLLADPKVQDAYLGVA